MTNQSANKRLCFWRSVLGMVFFTGTLMGAAAPPELPRVYLDTAYIPRTGKVIYVPAGGNLQTALNSAQPGDKVQLAAGAVFTGNFVLPAKTGNEWIYIETEPTPALPAEGVRVQPGFGLAKIVTPNTGAAITAKAGAHHYRLVGLEIEGSGSYVYNLVYLDNSDHITIDRCYIHGAPNQTVRRGIAINSASSAVVDSYINEMHEAGADSQAIAAWDGPGPVKIINNYLSAAGENVMFGGSLSSPNVVPSDIEIRGNYLFKPLEWMGTKWTVKNIFELKNAQRVLISGNVLENSWAAAQSGRAVIFTVRTNSGGPWAVVNDVTMTDNFVKNVEGGFTVTGFDSDATVGQQGESKRIRIANNVVTFRVGAPQTIGVLLLGERLQDTIIDHNVIGVGGCSSSFWYDTVGRRPVGQNVTITNNVLCTPPRGNSSQAGLDAISAFMPEPSPWEGRFFGNVMQFYAGKAWPMPPNNTQVAAVQLADAANGDYTLIGGTAGVNMSTLKAATAGAISGVRSVISESVRAAAVNLTLTTLTLPTATWEVTYFQTLTATGGSGPYTFTVMNGSIPPGLTLDATGVLSGIPSVIGAYSFTIKVRDANNATATRDYAVNTVATPPGPPVSVSANAGYASAIVTFAPPIPNGGAPITGYRVTSSPGGVIASGVASPIIVAGLNNGTAYTFSVVAVNAAGSGTISFPSNSVIPVAPPVVPVPTQPTQPAPSVPQTPMPTQPAPANPLAADPITFSPISFTGTSKVAAEPTGVFTAVFRHPGGSAKHYLGYMLFLPTPNVVAFQAQGSCLIEYNRISNGLRLINDFGNGWIGPIEGVPLQPTSPPLTNRACTVSMAGSSASVKDDMIVTLVVTFNTANVTQTMGMFLQALDVSGSWTDFRQFGTWQISSAKLMKPGPFVVTGSAPGTGSGTSATFDITVGHTAGITQIDQIHMRLSSAMVGSAPCHAIYFPVSNSMALVNDSGDALVGPITLGSGVLATNRCTIDTKKVGRLNVANGLNLTLPVTFNAGLFGGLKNLYINVFDRAGNLTHWVKTGSWLVQ